MWRWIAAGGPPQRRPPSSRRVELDDEVRDAYVRLRGNVAAVWREQRDLGHAIPPLRTLQAAFARELRPAERASAKRGEAGRREHGLYLRYEAPHRNAVWQADHKQLPVLVLAAIGRRPRRPWVTLFLDDYSRAIMGWAISLQPSSAEVLAALRDALVVHAGRGPFGGVPGRLRWDHGLEFAAGAVEHAALALGVDVDPATRTRRMRRARSSGCTARSPRRSSRRCPVTPTGPATSAGALRTPANSCCSRSSSRPSRRGCLPTTASVRIVRLAG